MKTYSVGGAVRDKLLGLPVSDRDHVVEATDAAHENRELVAAEAGDVVAVADARAQTIRGGAQDVVAGGVAEGLIDAPKAVHG